MSFDFLSEVNGVTGKITKPRPGLQMRWGTKRDVLDRFVTKFVRHVPPVCTKGGIKLSSGSDLAQTVKGILGRRNTDFIHGLEGPLLIHFFEAVLECEATARFKQGNTT